MSEFKNKDNINGEDNNLNEALANKVENNQEESDNNYIDFNEGKETKEIVKVIEETIDDKDIQAETFCRWAAARAGVVVLVPAVGTVALVANDVYLINRIAKIYGISLSEKGALAFLGVFGARLTGHFLATLIPIGVIQVPIAVSITYGVGKTFQAWVKDGMPTDMKPYLNNFNQWKDNAKDQMENFAKNPLKDVPLGDETENYIHGFNDKVKSTFETVKQEGEKITRDVLNKTEDLVEYIEKEVKKAKKKAKKNKDKIIKDIDDIDFEKEVKESVESIKEFSEQIIYDTEDLIEQAEDKIEDLKKKTKDIINEIKEEKDK